MAAGEREDPRPEGLRVLYLTASARGDLRVDEEVGRVQEAVRAAVHRDRVRIEHQPAATLGRFLDGLTRVVPHVVSFSGHGEEGGLEFDTGADRRGRPHRLPAEVITDALAAVDVKPQLVVLNACKTHAHLEGLVRVVPMAVGMRGSVGDPAAIAFASRFYAALADGQSVRAAFGLAKVQLAGQGLPDADLPVLECAPGVDPGGAVLVVPPPDPSAPDPVTA
ncbi:CHAT domain-containing protein [Actinomadura opuntiae]|uniref:CHAT domain-containing protein n=1 Tax=Actinomadura sp. OS1-43 TaxID=604315 RepID=UPI00255A9A7E|nr:CHAT domain-containing protein [Actinomadura sp. OS1-43]MDL4813703.1 CHAT domain-containing protein [Actinomadura sp. OS1-43]